MFESVSDVFGCIEGEDIVNELELLLVGMLDFEEVMEYLLNAWREVGF